MSLQLEYNKVNKIDPTPLRKKIADITDNLARENEDTESLLSHRKNDSGKRSLSRPTSKSGTPKKTSLPEQELANLILELSQQMLQAAHNLNFEIAARLRDELRELKRELRVMQDVNI